MSLKCYKYNLYSINLYFYSYNDNPNKELKEYQHNKHGVVLLLSYCCLQLSWIIFFNTQTITV